MKLKNIIIGIILIFAAASLLSLTMDDIENGPSTLKKFDTSRVHNFGNIWLRVSNYGFFGSGETSPKWPSLEYPGGSGVDYLYLGGLWFGAKKYRRDEVGRKLYWLSFPPVANDDVVAEGEEGWNPELHAVIDTLTSIGLDGWRRVNELLPAYNPLETSYLGTQYTAYNYKDVAATASIREQRKGVDDDGDGKIDEDPVGYAFPFREVIEGNELPEVFHDYGGDWLHNSEDIYGTTAIENEANQAIWFPLGFVDLSDTSNELYNFSQPNDDDGDGIFDEDGYPVSEQDFISYYYDYSPFPDGNPDSDRDYGSYSSSNEHVPLNIRVRQLSYQWSYEYIKNLVYIEFNITNMNIAFNDTLFDCAMGIYMDSDVGPQAWGASEIAKDDISSYVAGTGYEFAYTYDADGDYGNTTGYVGSRVCTPNPDSLEFACWTWDVSTGPDDWDPLDYVGTSNLTPNEKYWLLTGRNPDPEAYISLRDQPDYQEENNDNGIDTRYLFAFYGDMQGMAEPTVNSWNLQPGKTMKIVIAVFPGDNIPELKRTSGFAQSIYGVSQNIDEVILPDINSHYDAPEPPDFPKMHVVPINDGNTLEVYWDNRSEFSTDIKFVEDKDSGWQDFDPLLDSYYTGNMDDYADFPEEFKPKFNDQGQLISKANAIVNPWTTDRLRHDFQGYALYGRSGSGSQADWERKIAWDKIDSDQDLDDYMVNYGHSEFVDFSGDIGIDKDLPGKTPVVEADENYYHLNDLYDLVPYDMSIDEYKYGKAIYAWDVTMDNLPDLSNMSDNDKALLFISDELADMGVKGEEIYLTLYSRNLIPISGFVSDDVLDNPEQIETIRKNRLARRFYQSEILYPPKGIEYYVAMTAFDRGAPAMNVFERLESGRDANANMKILFPGPSAKSDMDDIYVVPNPYVGHSKFDGKREDDDDYEKSRRLWFVNLPERCTIKIYSLAGDLVDKLSHEGNQGQDIISLSKALNKDAEYISDFSATGIEPWDLLSRNDQIIAPGVYLFSVKDKDSGDIKVGKFVVIK